mmetsp:Transcript_16199/g.32806  ORF Transcript_16199/g.32806 Transcript_16199/m.32806 type:complete len:105 (+) Transcript_16199:1482-1796(+)
MDSFLVMRIDGLSLPSFLLSFFLLVVPLGSPSRGSSHAALGVVWCCGVGVVGGDMKAVREREIKSGKERERAECGLIEEWKEEKFRSSGSILPTCSLNSHPSLS